MTAVGCDNASTDDADAAALNGTWVDSDGYEIKLNNGSFEASEEGNPMAKGTYTTSGNNITIQITHIHGSMFEGMLESKWYTKAELKTALKASFDFLMPRAMDAQIDVMFVPQTGTYSISGNTLTMTMAGETTTFTRK
jgi:hypothetical protein